MSVSVSSGVTKALWRREPIMALIRAMISAVDSTAPWITAESWMVALRVMLRSMRGLRRDERRDVAEALLLQGQVGGDVPDGPPSHSDAWSHCSSVSRSSRSAVRARWSSIAAQTRPPRRRSSWSSDPPQVKTGGRTRVRLSSKNCG